jgi:TrmH family RNA methyltransferase
MRTVSSRQNQAVRAFRALADEPDVTGARLLLDGAHLVRDAHASTATFEIVAVAASRLEADTEERTLARLLDRAGTDVIIASDQVFSAMSPVKTPSGILAIALRRPTTAIEICGRPGGLLLVAADVQDPGNIGGLLRAAEAGGVTGALICASDSSASANPFSWKALRGSMGSALRLPIAADLDAGATIDAVKRARVRTIAAVPRGGADPDAIDWSGHVAIVLGGEGPGLADAIVHACDETVSIPMAAPVESLNVAVAGAILVYAARRQRLRAGR